MELKDKVALLTFLSCMSLMSVGFSSWNIVTGDEETIEGVIKVDKLETPTYLKFEQLKSFKYSYNGFLKEFDPTTGKVGSLYNTMSIKYNIEFDRFFEHFKDATNVYVAISVDLIDATPEQCSAFFNYLDVSIDNKTIQDLDTTNNSFDFEYEIYNGTNRIDSFVLDFVLNENIINSSLFTDKENSPLFQATNGELFDFSAIIEIKSGNGGQS